MKRARSRSRPHGAKAPLGEVFPVVAKKAIDTLQIVDGRASGLKFNKLVVELFWHLSKSENKAMHFDLPHRWYLHGAVVDDVVVHNLVRFDHPDDEARTNAIWVGPPRPKVPTKAEGLLEEVELFSERFAKKYAGNDGVPAMLVDHYAKAPLDFQRDFLSWSLLTRDVLNGYQKDSPAQVLAQFNKLTRTYPPDLEPRPKPSFERLTLYLEPYIQDRVPGDFRVVRQAVEALWDFWTVFCLFLSIRYNTAIPRDRLDRYRARAETELEAYKRRLVSYLEERYLREPSGIQNIGFDLNPLGRFLSEEIRAHLDGGD